MGQGMCILDLNKTMDMRQVPCHGLAPVAMMMTIMMAWVQAFVCLMLIDFSSNHSL